MPNYAGSSRKLYHNEKYVCSNHNDIKNAFIPFRNKEINVCLATNSSPADWGMAMQDYGLGLRVGLKDLPTLRTRLN